MNIHDPNTREMRLLLFMALTLALSPLAIVSLSALGKTEAQDRTAAASTTGPSNYLTPNMQAAPWVADGVVPVVLYHHQDATGNLAAMTDEAGQVAWRADVRPYGQGTANPPDHPLRLLDQPREAVIGAEDGLYHLGARTYDPLTGRFLSADPLPMTGIALEEPQRFNQYAYGLNNPYRYTDPTGLAPKPKKASQKPQKPPPRPKPPEPRGYIDPITGKPNTEPFPEPRVIDLDPTEEVTEIRPVRTGGNTTPSLGEVVPEGFDPENPDNVDTEVDTEPDGRQQKKAKVPTELMDVCTNCGMLGEPATWECKGGTCKWVPVQPTTIPIMPMILGPIPIPLAVPSFGPDPALVPAY